MNRTLLRFVWRADGLAGVRLVLPFSMAVGMAVAARSASSLHFTQIMILPAALLVLFGVMARHQRGEARAYLQGLPVSRRALAGAELAVDLVPVVAMAIVSMIIRPGTVAVLPLLVLAGLWSVAWSMGEPKFWRSLAGALTFAGLLAVLSVFGIVGTSLACVAVAGWLALRTNDGDLTVAPSASVTHEQKAAEWSTSLPGGGRRLLAALALGGTPGMLALIWSAFVSVTAIWFAPSAASMVLMPVMFTISIAMNTATRCKGPSREFLLTRPIARWRYFLPPIAVALATMTMPSLVEWGHAHRLEEAALDQEIRFTIRLTAPRMHDGEETWRLHYERTLRDEFALPTLPSGALEANPDRAGRLAYVPTAGLRAAVRAAWEGRQLRIALIIVTVFLLVFAYTRPADVSGGAPRWPRGWQWLGLLIAVPYVLVPHHPEWLIFPLWPLLLLAPIAALLCWRSLVTGDAA
jgi:hypothetical protein